jgi:transposase
MAEPALQDMPPAPGDVDPKAIQRTLRCLADSNVTEDREERTKAMNQCTAAQLTYVCDILHIDRSAIEMSKKKTKSGLVALLSSQVRILHLFHDFESS